MKFELPVLPYRLDEFEPFISKKAMEVHYRNHHQNYINDLNTLINGTKFENSDLETILKISDGRLFNAAAQSWNHTFFFEGLMPGSENDIKGSFAIAIGETFGSFEFFRESFIKATISLFGSGWVWLILNPSGTIAITSEQNAGNPLRRGLAPLLAFDVWEHAYYLDYTYRRLDYVNNLWNFINWDRVALRYYEAIKVSKGTGKLRINLM